MTNIFLDKDYSKLGDSIVNAIGSIVKTQLYNKPMGIKVKDKILAEALKLAGLRTIFPKRLSVGSQGDIVEAIIAYLWLEKKLDIKVAVEIMKHKIEKEFKAVQVRDASFEDFLFAKGFAEILTFFYEDILKVVNS